VLDGNWLTRSGGLYCLFSRYHPYVATAWGSDILIEAERSRILRAIGKLTVRVADAVIVDSNIQRRAVLSLGCRPSKIYSFPWGIDLDRFKPMPNDSAIREELGWERNKIIVSTRNHSPVYGVEYLIRAIPIVLEKVKEARFLIAGDGPLLAYHKALAEELGVQDYVHFLGRVQNNLLPDILNSADLYVSTSLSDGTSASLLEALATGLPSVVTAIPANREWMVEGVNGFLTPPKDSEALAKRIIQLLENRKAMLEMRDSNVRVARERADWKINSLELEKCIADQLNQKYPR
jgi:glycosyltransferase involved in cell wall biosynthesis